jgi:hypothetical protein
VTKVDQLRLELRALAARVGKLESGQSARRKREPAPRPADAAKVRETQRLWQEYQTLAAQVYGLRCARASKSKFADRFHLSEREFRRAFSLADARGLGTAPRARYNSAIREAAGTLREALKQSPGTHRVSPLSGLRPAV